MLGRVKTPPREELTPPPSIAPPPLYPGNIAGVLSGNRVPPLFVYTQRREPPAGPALTMAPDDSLGVHYSQLNIGWQEAPDPIRQSDFWASGNKCSPAAQMRIPSNTAIGSIEAVSEQTFRIGKLLGYMHRPMYAGTQQPWRSRVNIQEAIPTTYGSQFQIYDTQGLGGPATAAGFVLPTSTSNDGYPY
jgi:hypothetical protein